MRKHLSTIVLVILLLIGLSLLLYPTVSDYWNSFHQTRAIATYAENVAALDNASYDAIWDAARQYNRNPVSYTHLDVYKSQRLGQRRNGDTVPLLAERNRASGW